MQFRTKARAVDLLGKGQIADLPTAITELWKNGYDAYADNLTAEIYLEGYKGLDQPMFVLTDDGKGMSQRDIFEKWLVLGTDSKSRAKLEKEESEETLWKKPRIKAGEKGIGRLSVAFLGSPMLMITKKQGHPLQGLFFDWRLLENYNLFLDDIIIPVKEFTDTDEIENVYWELAQEFLENLEKCEDEEGRLIWEDSQIELRNEIENAVTNLTPPDFIYEELIADMMEIDEDHGTKFLIFDPIDQIIDLTKKDEDKLEDREFVLASLSGFTNQFLDQEKVIKTSIPVYKKENLEYDFLNSQGNFFTFHDFDLADVIIDGKFDGNGSFNGKLFIYGEEIDYSYTSPRKKNSSSFYGKFPIKLGYSQGYKNESKLSETAWKKINDKVENYGALYIYRDNFRVLPYGRTDFDFLGFERRRALRAGTWYFSHRRMFGYIGLTREHNNKLKDKSSREGLINNAAFRAFRDDLIDFFKELALSFFGTEAKEKSIFLDKKEKLKNQSKEIEKDKKRETQEKRAFTRSLKDYPKRFEAHQEEYKSLISELEEKTNSVEILYSDIERVLDRINTLNIEYKSLLPEVPKRYEPTETQKDRLEKYENSLIEFNQTIKAQSEELVKVAKEKLQIQELRKEFSKGYQKYKANLENKAYEKKRELNKMFNSLLEDYSKRTERILKELDYEKESLVENIVSKKQVLEAIDKIESKFEFLREQIEKELMPLVEHVNRLSFDIDEELLQGAYKAEYDNIKRRWEQTRETAQLGVAVEIIDHEFNHLYSTINNTLDKLSKDEYINDSAQFEFLKTNLKLLEEKYDLLSPLYRISGVTIKDIHCKQIFKYLKRFFSNNLEVQEILFKATQSFKDHIISIKEPVIHTVFINVINNALYWLRNSEEKIIRLDYWEETDEILIINSGSKIEEHRLERIFELFYSNRPNGRGIGLYLAKESLNENYFDIYATNDKTYNQLNGACFVIKPLN
nr:ATP-binding protein [uncultured Draconibacterium sp.]